MGKAGSKAAGKVAALFLAGIAVMMIRSGIQAMIGQ
jgi:small neutral amino acid transporter SnatA (MarC family)